MKGEPIRGPKFSGINDGMSDFEFTDSENSALKKSKSPL